MFCRLHSSYSFSGAFSLRKAACYEKPGGEVLLWQVHISQCKKCRGLRYRSSTCKVQPRFWKVHKAFFFNVIECGLPWTWIWKYAEQTNPGLFSMLSRSRWGKDSRRTPGHSLYKCWLQRSWCLQPSSRHFHSVQPLASDLSIDLSIDSRILRILRVTNKSSVNIGKAWPDMTRS